MRYGKEVRTHTNVKLVKRKAFLFEFISHWRIISIKILVRKHQTKYKIGKQTFCNKSKAILNLILIYVVM